MNYSNSGDENATYIPVEKVACIVGVSAQAIRNWSKQGRFPKPKHFSTRTVRWNRAEVEWHLLNPSDDN